MFTHLLLADEINRAPAKTQSALLEVMQEYQVTLEGQTLPLPKPFMVLATQNPVETEGTYPLPEAQLDRFLFKIEIGYPTLAEEVGDRRAATTGPAGDELPLGGVQPCIERAARRRAAATSPRSCASTSRSWTTPCASCRATRERPGLAARRGLARRARARARARAPSRCSQGRNFVTPDDVKSIALPALRHRVALAPDARSKGRTPNELLAAVIDSVAAPRA